MEVEIMEFTSSFYTRFTPVTNHDDGKAYEVTGTHHRLHAIYDDGTVEANGSAIPEGWFDQYVQIQFERAKRQNLEATHKIVDFVIVLYVNEEEVTTRRWSCRLRR